MDNLPLTRALVQDAMDRIDEVERSAAQRFEDYEAAMKLRDKHNFRWRCLFAALLFLLLIGGLFLASVLKDYVDATNHNATAIEQSNEIRANEAREACERGNATVEVFRFIINGQFDDYLLGPNALNNPDRQAQIEARRTERLHQLDRLRPLRDCEQAAEEAVTPGG